MRRSSHGLGMTGAGAVAYGRAMAAPRSNVTPLQASPRLLSWIAAMAEALTLPLLLVRADGTLLNANMAGCRETQRAQWLVLRGERVAPADAARSAELAAALQRAARERQRIEWPVDAQHLIVIAPVIGERGVPMLMLVLPAEAAMDEACRLFAYQYELSESELDVLYALCQGHTPRQIAALRRVSLSTVRRRLARVKTKCGEDLLGTLVPRIRSLPPVDVPR